MRRLRSSALLAFAAVAISLPACSRGQSGTSAGGAANAGSAAASSGTSGIGTKGPDERVKVAFISNNPYEFWTIAQRGTEKASREFSADVQFKMPPRGTSAEQRQIIEDLLAMGVEGIAISPNDAANQASFLDEIADRLPLITQDSDLPPGSKRICYIGTNNYQAGQEAGRLVKAAMPNGGRVIIFVGKLDVQNAVERRQGVLDELAAQTDARGPQLGKYTLLDTLTDDALQEKCKSNAEDALVKHGGDPAKLCLVGLWAYNPPAMLAAVKGAGLEGKVAIVGFDENEETLQGIKDGHIHATVVQQPFEFGYQAVRLLAGLLRGDRSVLPADGVMYVPHRVIARDNVEEFHAELRQLKQPQ